MAEVAAKFPRLRIVINHCCPRVGGGPEAIAEWKLLVQEGLAGPGGVGLAVGSEHRLLVDAEGRARSWGDGRFGQLGHGSDDGVTVPRVIASLATERVKCVAAGINYSLVLTAEGFVYSFGFSGYGALGLGGTIS